LLVDSHCHLDSPDFDADRAAMLDRARAAGVGLMLNPGADLNTSRRAVELAAEHPEIYAAVGVSPHEAEDLPRSWLDQLRALAGSSDKVLAIGEIGLDFFRSKVSPKVQEQVFVAQIELAWELDLPAIVHCRQADERVLELLQQHSGEGRLRAVMHCFSGDEKLARGALALGFFISFAGSLTYPKARPTRRAAELAPDDRILVETDAPYLPPQSVRGKRCEPAMIAETVEKLAAARSATRRDIERVTERNFHLAFGLPIIKREALLYPIGETLYVNLTNRCPNSCGFCPRQHGRFVHSGHDLQLSREADGAEYVKALSGFTDFKELVFCGFGESTVRLEALKEVAKAAKARGMTVRLDTNGLGSVINARNIVPELRGLIDEVWVSLNAPDARVYHRLTKSEFGDSAYGSVVEFAHKAQAAGLKVTVTAVNCPGIDIGACLKAAKRLKLEFRSRKYKKLG
jgi:TatD DNase family protein